MGWGGVGGWEGLGRADLTRIPSLPLGVGLLPEPRCCLLPGPGGTSSLNSRGDECSVLTPLSIKDTTSKGNGLHKGYIPVQPIKAFLTYTVADKSIMTFFLSPTSQVYKLEIAYS